MLIKFCTYNIKFESADDFPNLWSKRLPWIQYLISENSPDFLGTQEGRRPQIQELHEKLSPLQAAFNHREWIESRMYPSIFFSPRWLLLNSSDIWLSDTPKIAGSSSFDSMFPRLCTCAHFKHSESKNELLIINVHLDHKHPHTREQQIDVLISETEKIRKRELPLIIMGDFNEGPQGKVRSILLERIPNLFDPWKKLSQAEVGSHHRFDGDISQTKRIDWILCSSEFNAIDMKMEKRAFDGIWPSDHFPVFLQLEL